MQSTSLDTGFNMELDPALSGFRNAEFFAAVQPPWLLFTMQLPLLYAGRQVSEVGGGSASGTYGLSHASTSSLAYLVAHVRLEDLLLLFDLRNYTPRRLSYNPVSLILSFEATWLLTSC